MVEKNGSALAGRWVMGPTWHGFLLQLRKSSWCLWTCSSDWSLQPWLREGGHGTGLAGGQGAAAQLPTSKRLGGPLVIISSKMLWQGCGGLGACWEARSLVYNRYSHVFQSLPTSLPECPCENSSPLPIWAVHWLLSSWWSNSAFLRRPGKGGC